MLLEINVTSNCKAVIYTDSIADGSPVTEIKFFHSHIGDSLAAERRIVRNAAHQIASQNPSLPARRIIAQATGAASDKTITRVEPPVPTTSTFDIPEMFLSNNDGTPFVLFDSATTNDIADGRIIILGSRGTLEMLASADRIGGDGSFSRSPPGFMQFYTLHAQNGQSFKPCVQFLMTQRTIPFFYVLWLEQLQWFIF
uniref:Uncharacterized protein n=1 Tax=Panagrolaimus superbus TaxID=310955 RepID=A0A914Z1M8_9BILA